MAGWAEGLAERAAAAAQVLVDDLGHPEPSADDLHHLSRVLRLRDGEAVVAADGRGGWRLCRFRTGNPAGTSAGRAGGRSAGRTGRAGEPPPPGRLQAAGPVRAEAPPPFELTVAFAPAKGDRPEWVVQKLTELGIDRLVPLLAERSVVRWEGARARSALARLRRVAREAACQSRRVWLPVVDEPATLAALAATLPSPPAAPSAPAAPGDRPGVPGDGFPVLADLGGPPLAGAVRVVAIGPEGGWSPSERGLGLPRVGLGPRVLRAETAAVAAGALLSAVRDGTVQLAGHGPAAVGGI